MACPFLHKPVPCARRQEWTTPAPSDCRACDFSGRKATSTEAVDPPVMPRPKTETIALKKEKLMPAKMTTKEKVLAGIKRRGSARPTILMQTCHASAEQLKAIAAELEREGKIKSWPYRGRSGMTAIFTMPDAKDPRAKEMLEAKPQGQEKKAPVTKTGSPAPPVPRNGAKPASRPAGNGNPYAAAIADLEARRTKALNDAKNYDTAIETLLALA